jgi:hypothetical protein
LKEKIEKTKASNSDERKSPKETTSVAIEVSLDFIYPRDYCSILAHLNGKVI